MTMNIKPILFNTEMVKAIQDGRKTQTRRIAKQLCGLDPRVDGLLPKNFKFWVSPYTSVVYWEDLERQVTVDGKIVLTPCWRNDILWVRETWRPAKGTMHTYIHGEITESEDWHDGYEYRAGGYSFPDGFKESSDYYHLSEIRSGGSWKPSIHMPKEAARIFLRVKDVRVERLRQITQQGAVSEGISRLFDHMTKAEYEKWAIRSGVEATQSEQPWKNYLWHGHFGAHGMGNKISDAWSWQFSSYETPCGSFSSLWNSTVPLKEWDKYGWDANPWVWVIEFERCEKPEGWC